MDCRTVREIFFEQLDDPAASRPALAAHLQRCAGCRREWEAYRQTVKLLGRIPAPALSRDLSDGIHQRLSATTPLRELLRPLHAGILAAAGLAVILLLVALPLPGEGLVSVWPRAFVDRDADVTVLADPSSDVFSLVTWKPVASRKELLAELGADRLESWPKQAGELDAWPALLLVPVEGAGGLPDAAETAFLMAMARSLFQADGNRVMVGDAETGAEDGVRLYGLAY